MTDADGFLLNTRLWAALCVGSIGLMVGLSVFGHVVAPRLWSNPDDMNRAGRVVLPVFGGLFLVLAFSAVPLMVNLLVAGLTRLWTEFPAVDHPLRGRALDLMHQYREHVIVGLWCVFLAGLLVAAPVAIREWARDPGLPWYQPPEPAGRRAPAGAMPPLEYVVQHARQILLMNTVIGDSGVRYSVIGLLKQERAIVDAGSAQPLAIDTGGYESLGYQPAPGQTVVMFFGEPDSTGKTLIELLLPAADGTMRYPAYRTPPDPVIDRVLTLDQLREMVATLPAP